jgi:hypothetical protein
MNENPTVLTILDHVDPKATPLDINELIDLLNPRLHSEIQGSYLPYVIQHDTPDTNNRNKAWIELDTQGRPISTKIFWHGSWRRIYNGMLGEIRMFSGDPSNTQLWQESGRGQPGEIYDGWAICNGNNGTPDLSDRFIIGAHMNNHDHPGYSTPDGGWVSWISNTEAEHEGGVRDITLDKDNTYRAPIEELKVGKWAADTNAHSSTGQMFGDVSATSGENRVIIDADEGNTEPPAISTIPPFIAMGFIAFIGYAT